MAQSYLIKIDIKNQLLSLLRDQRIVRQYRISTSRYGAGNAAGSNKTPLGRHKIVRKIGAGARAGTVFVGRRNTRRVAKIFSRKPKTWLEGDLITTRILRLRGLEPGINRGNGIDSYRRFIYIHGTPQEWLIGRPVSHGCVRMRNRDVRELFGLVPSGTAVSILP